MRIQIISGLLLLLSACHGHKDEDWVAGTPTYSTFVPGPGARLDGGADGGLPSDGGTGTSIGELVALATSGRYQGWRRDPGVHNSSGPHVTSGKIRIFMNDQLASSQELTPHAPGSIAVMELYDNAGTEVIGHALSAKVPGGWIFIRGFRSSSYSVIDFDSSAIGFENPHPCTGCHVGGVDYVWSRVR